MFVLAKNRCKFVNYCIVIEKQISVIVIYSMQTKQFYCDCLTDLFQFGTFKLQIVVALPSLLPTHVVRYPDVYSLN